ncbi:MAG: DHHA1 domain-containing protein, partial [Bacteroidota bacterium]
PKHPAKNVAALQEENKQLKKQIEALRTAQANALKGNLLQQVEVVNGVNFLATQLPLDDSNAIKTLGYQLEKELGQAVIVFGAIIKEKPQLMIIVSKELVTSHGLNAGQMVRNLAQAIKGGGGGQPFFATAGGKDVNGLPQAIANAKSLL